MHVVLLEPEIPPNTGNVARLCAATRTTLHLIEPLGFRLDDAQLKRAGMDYWHQVTWQRWANWIAFERALKPSAKLWLVESNGPQLYTHIRYAQDDYLVFGRETAGIPKALLDQHRDRWIGIPMINPEARSINLSNSVAIVLFEALRQMHEPQS
jgi:tRNA (cytidine/uridine-2'-O-)-methyltransferase